MVRSKFVARENWLAQAYRENWLAQLLNSPSFLEKRNISI